MKKISILLLFIFSITTFNVKADEGMWLPLLIKRLNYADMQKKGLKLTAEEIYSVNNSSLKDAIVSFGGFCTGEMISSQGLLLTNHHCGYGSIQKFSTVDNNILKNGFWAKTKADEINDPELTATFLVRMEDVTKQILGAVTDDMDEKAKAEAIEKTRKELIEKATEGTHYTAYIKSFFYGNEYYMFVNETFLDVRLVGTPPESVGKYGGDTDNWMWPRHTGDFSMFRVYMGKDGKPAPYSKDNVPYKPKHHLPVSVKGINEGDFSMIMGYPGSTDRYLSSHGVKQLIDIYAPAFVEVRDLKLKTMKADMDKSEKVKIQYASKYARTSNYWKYYIGQKEQLQKNGVYDRKLKLENNFTKWVNETPERKEKYGKALDYIANYYKKSNEFTKGDVYALQAGLTGPDIFLYTYRMNSLIGAIKGTEEKINKQINAAESEEEKNQLLTQLNESKAKLIAKLKEMTTKHFKDYNKKTDQKLVENLLGLYYKNVVNEQHPAFFKNVKNADFKKYSKQLFCKSVFAKEKKVNKLISLLEKGKTPKKAINEDKAVIAATDLINLYRTSGMRYGDAEANMKEGYRLFVEGIRLMYPNKSFYPNANSTQRLTYGNVMSYEVSDDVIKMLKSKDGVGSFYTTMEGLIEKEDATNPEFEVPAKLKELYEKKDYGRYADKKTGKLHVCFLSNNDITGGNSGSPVINGNGELIGTAFDGNWEAMSGDISFENSVQRTISVDIRYTLFIIDKLAGASHIIDEMTLVE